MFARSSNQEFFDDKIARSYDHVHGRVVAARQRFLEQRYYQEIAAHGETVLDIGNGGHLPADVLGDQVAERVPLFVGIDDSVQMLERKPLDFPRVVGNGMALPFGDRSFGYVVINGVLHHLGFGPDESHAQRAAQLIGEALRVSRRGVIIYEPVTWDVLERLEAAAFSLLRSFPLFMFSASSLLRVLNEIGSSSESVSKRTLADLTSPLYCYPLVMAATWLKLPAFLSPIDHLFLIVRPSGDG